jgi:hypothetical protein
MREIVLFAAAAAFLLHLTAETLSTFVKYNFSSLRRQMTGVSYSNIIALASRGFIAVYGVLVSMVIERNLADIYFYAIVFAVVCLLGAGVSFVLSGLKFVGYSRADSVDGRSCATRRFCSGFEVNDHRSAVRIHGLTAIAIGTQFLSVVVAYGMCFAWPDNRLFIISLVPVFSTIGSLVTFVWVEPRLAKMVDEDNLSGYAASREFLRARALSFVACAAFMFGMALLLAR